MPNHCFQLCAILIWKKQIPIQAGNTIAKSIISRGFSEEFIESIVRISGSKSLVAAQQAIDQLFNLGVSKNLIKEVGERFGQEGLTALARLIKTGGVTEGEISTLLNAGYDMARLEMLAENNLIQAAVQSENIIHNLNNVGNFNSTALKHILQSEINAGGRVVGFHYEGMPYSGGKVTPGTAEAPNSYGVYSHLQSNVIPIRDILAIILSSYRAHQKITLCYQFSKGCQFFSKLEI